jgi:hypothetical protein
MTPDGLPFPYQKTGTQMGGFGSHTVGDGVCLWDSRTLDFPLAGTVFRAGTQGATQVDMVVEIAIASQARMIVTHNIRDFAPAKRLGLQVLAPGAFLKHLLGR